MRVKDRFIGFEWDEANIRKSYFKHGITPKESEEVFLDSKLQIIPDAKHSLVESRFIAVGKTLEGKSLFVAFCIRRKKIRVISARRMHGKEVKKYEKIRKNKKV